MTVLQFGYCDQAILQFGYCDQANLIPKTKKIAILL